MIHGDRGAHPALGQPVAFGPLPRECRSAQLVLLVLRSQPKQRPSQVAAVVSGVSVGQQRAQRPFLLRGAGFSPGINEKLGFSNT